MFVWCCVYLSINRNYLLFFCIYSPHSVSTLRVSYGRSKSRCLIRVFTLGPSIFPHNFCIKWLLWNAEVHFDCAGSHKVVLEPVPIRKEFQSKNLPQRYIRLFQAILVSLRAGQTPEMTELRRYWWVFGAWLCHISGAAKRLQRQRHLRCCMSLYVLWELRASEWYGWLAQGQDTIPLFPILVLEMLFDVICYYFCGILLVLLNGICEITTKHQRTSGTSR